MARLELASRLGPGCRQHQATPAAAPRRKVVRSWHTLADARLAAAAAPRPRQTGWNCGGGRSARTPEAMALV